MKKKQNHSPVIILLMALCFTVVSACGGGNIVWNLQQDGGPKGDGGVAVIPGENPPPPPDRVAPPPPDRVVPPPPPDRRNPPPPPDRRTPPPPPDRRNPPPPPDRRNPPPPDRTNPNCCKNGATKPCYSGSTATRNKGNCKDGLSYCAQCVWTACRGQVLPAIERCDGKDNDCDGLVDESHPGLGGACTVPRKSGECVRGTNRCIRGKLTCVSQGPKTDVCDGKDNDCDGKIDEGDPLVGKPCQSSGGPCGKGVYACVNARRVCRSSGGTPKPEVCDGKDNDCDGQVDENLFLKCFSGNPKYRNVGACVDGRRICKSGKYGACIGFGKPAVEVCDNIDNDCDGSTDEGNVCVPPGRGPVYRLNSFAFANSGQGFDLTGDGKVDNKLSSIGTFVNNTLQGAVKNGSLNILLELAKLSNSTAQSGTVTVYVYMGRRSGTGYKIEPSSLDAQKRPLFRFAGKITNGVVKAGPGRASLLLPLFGSNVPFLLEKAYIQFRVARGLATLSSGLLGGAVPAGNLDKISAASIPFLGGPGKTVMDVLVQLGTQPDIDLDRDGLEFFTLGTAGISTCTDGNSTKISGGTCAQDKRIADGLSVAFSFTAARTKIVP